MPKTNALGLKLMETDEGDVLYAYDDGDGKWPHPPIMPGDPVKGVLTIGRGHTGPDVHPGQKIDENESNTLFVADLHGFEVAVNNLVSHDINSNQFSALVSFAYNVGSGNLSASSLLKRLNEGDVQGAADEFGEWIRDSTGAVSAGLVTRRAQERALFLTPC